MTGTEIIEKFELYTDDTTELSPEEEIDLANRVLHQIYDELPWEFLRKEYSTTVASSAVAIAADFDYPMVNYTEDNTSDVPDTKVLYIGTDKSVYPIVPMGSRYGATKQGNWCYYNPTTTKFEFVTAPTNGETAVYDYKYVPTDITTATSPVLPTNAHMMVVFGMLIDDEIIQKSEKARSNVPENTRAYNKLMSQLRARNARQFFN